MKALASILSLTLALYPVAAFPATLDLFGTSYVFENGLSNATLTPGDCVQAGAGGLFTTTAAACGTGSGTVTAVTGSGVIVSSGGTTPNITCPTCGTGSGTVTAVTASGNLASSGGTTPNISISNGPTFSGTVTAANLAATSLTAGNCVQATTGGQLITIVGACGTSSGTVTAVTASGNAVSSGGTTPNITLVNAPTFSGQVTGASFDAGNLTSGDCLFSTAGVITSASTACTTGPAPLGQAAFGTVTAPFAFSVGGISAVTSTSALNVNPGTPITISDVTRTHTISGLVLSINSVTSFNLLVQTITSGATPMPAPSLIYVGVENPFLNSLAAGQCVSTAAGGLIQATGAACATGTVTSVTGTANQITSTNPTTTPVLSIPSTFIAPGTIAATTSLKAGNLTSGDCLYSVSGVITSSSTACAAGGGSVTSVTSANNLISITNPTTTPVLTANESPVFTGNVTSNSGLIDGGFGGITACVGSFNAAGLLAVNTNCVSQVVAGTGITITTPGSSPTLNVTNPVTATAPTQQNFLSGSGTYTTPANVKWIEIKAVGGGGGGAGSDGTTSQTAGGGGAGGNTTFGTTLIVANGGGGGFPNAGTGYSTGGTASLGSALGQAFTGSGGSSPAAVIGIAGTYFAGGAGGASALGGAGGAAVNQLGQSAAVNSGSGGSGAATGNAAGTFTGGGGASGGYVDAHINAPLATYAYAVGAAGTAGTAGTSGTAGGAGGSGGIWITEHYNY